VVTPLLERLPSHLWDLGAGRRCARSDFDVVHDLGRWGTARRERSRGTRWVKLTSMVTHTFTVEPDYGQFYARRAGAPWASADVPSEGYERALWSDGAFVYIGTYRRYGTTSVEVSTLTGPPIDDADPAWQHVAEVSLDPGGDLEIFSWGADVPVATVPIEAGPVRLRVLWRGLVGGRFEGMDDDGESDEGLGLLIWPEPPREAAVLRWWEHWHLPPPSSTAPDGRRQIEGLEDVVERLPALELVVPLGHPSPPMPGGGPGSSVHALLRDPADGSWWVDGYDVRRTLREIAEPVARSLHPPLP